MMDEETEEDGAPPYFLDAYAARAQAASEMMRLMMVMDREEHGKVYDAGLEFLEQLRKTFKTAPVPEPRIIHSGKMPR